MLEYFKDGEDGMICIYLNDNLICGYALGELSVQDYIEMAYDMIVSGMRDNKKIAFQIFTYSQYCKEIYKKFKRKIPIEDEDYRLFLICILSLIKLKILEWDDIVMVFPNYKKIKERKKLKRLSLNM